MLRLTFAILVTLLWLAPAQAAETARYRLELHITWSQANHPHEWPENGGHMSGLIGVTHNSRYIMFGDGRTATSGLKLVAENGRATIMRAEFVEAQRRERLGTIFSANGLKVVPGVMSAEFDISGSHPFVSFVTMLAPSPDWFTGLSSLRLSQGGQWATSVRLPLWVWDAGTDNGVTFLSRNQETQPAESTRLLATPHFLDENGLKSIGYALLTKLD
ncbi:MAG: spondin domain-containing protein [Pseudomonadota bacterium]